MDDFPVFMKNMANAIPPQYQSPGVTGWFYDGIGNQMAYWICERDGASQEHQHEFEEYLVVLQGVYTLIVNNQKHVLQKGDEYFIPPGVSHSGEFVAGTRTIHCFGGSRVKRP